MGQSYAELLASQRRAVSDGIFAAVRRLRWPAERLAAERERRLRELLAFAAQRSPLWRERLAHIDPETFTEADLPKLPVLTRTDLMGNFDALLTEPKLELSRLARHIDSLDVDAYFDGGYRVVATSGSTGERVLFVYDFDEWVTFVLISTRWQGRSANDLDETDLSLGTLFASNSTHVSGALHAFFAGAGSAPVTHLPATLPLPAIVAGLNAAAPALLQGYPSALHLLALEAKAGRLTIAPRRVSSCGEQCTPEAREAVRAAWGLEIVDYWGVSEGIYAFPCGVGEGMHLPDDLAIVEPVDRDGRPVAAGEPADKILLTNLYNHTQPLIRYEITDAMTLIEEPCECGCAHRRIADIRGRTDAFFIYAGGAAVHWLGMTTVLLADPNVVEMQVTQTPRGAVVSLVGRGACDVEAIRRGLEALMASSGLREPEVEIRQVDSLERMWSGKLRQFEPLADLPAA
jgi:phenylacetate-coenzyme A ligase PaaK-like adenylate-forming protein